MVLFLTWAIAHLQGHHWCYEHTFIGGEFLLIGACLLTGIAIDILAEVFITYPDSAKRSYAMLWAVWLFVVSIGCFMLFSGVRIHSFELIADMEKNSEKINRIIRLCWACGTIAVLLSILAFMKNIFSELETHSLTDL